MKAIGSFHNGLIDSLVEVAVEPSSRGPRDLLVGVRGISLNPADIEVRTLLGPENGPKSVRSVFST